jgi:16S rRNA processing protein RimM
LSPEPAARLEVGRIAKPHGLRGQVVVELTSTETSRVAPGSVLHAGDRALVVRDSTPHQRRWIVTFEGVAGREAAQALAGTVLSADAKAAPDDGDADALWAHDLIGAHVVDLDGTDWGEVVALVDNPASDLLELASGQLVPLRFVVGSVEVESAERRVRIDPPAGLLGEEAT